MLHDVIYGQSLRVCNRLTRTFLLERLHTFHYITVK